MAEDKTESIITEGSELIQGLQQKLNQFVDGIHQMAEKKDLENLGRIFYSFIHDFDPTYRRIPEGFHLKLGLTPTKWDEIRNDQELKPFAQEEQTPSGLKYFLEVTRVIQNYEQMAPNSSAVNMGIRGSPDEYHFVLEMLSRSKGPQDLESLRAEDIVSIEIVPDTKPQ